MLSNGFDAPLHLELSTSRILLYFKLLVHLLALVAISLPSGIPIIVKILLYIFVIFSAVITLRKFWQSALQQQYFIWQKKSLWVEYLDGKEQLWHAQSDHLVTPWFVIVKLCNTGNTLLLLILKDQCDKQTFRRLRVRLKYFQGEAAIPADAS